MALTSQQIIALQCIPGCGSKTIRNITDFAKDLSIETTSEFACMVNECIQKKIAFRIKNNISIEDATEYLDKADYIIEKSLDYGIHVTNYQEENFPKMLLETIDESGKPDIPIIIYYKGDLSITQKPGIAIIGTREPTLDGIKAGNYLGKLFADKGYNIVSGLAAGCDTAGHKGAISSFNGKTTAFLAHGLDMVYPSENEELANNIIDKGGLLMSEYPIGTKVNRYNLVARDRLQAALADATIVIQTGIKGGTMHASNTTLISGKPLFCVKYLNQQDCNKISGNEFLVNKGAYYLTSKDAIEKVEQAIHQYKYKNTSHGKEQELFL